MSDQQTARIALPYLAAGQMQKHVTLNEALTRLDALVHAHITSRTIDIQPELPADGALYLLPADASGETWSSLTEGTLVRAEAGQWTAVEPPLGMVAYVADVPEFLLREEDGWTPVGERLGAIQRLDLLGVGAAADAANPLSACLNRVLFTARSVESGGDGDLCVVLNKVAGANDLGLQFQSAGSGRAELALTGDGTFQLKVSSDGVGWTPVWSVDGTTGRVIHDQGAQRRSVTVMTASGSYAPPAWARTIEVVAVGGGGGGGAGFAGPSGSRFGGGGGGAGGVSRGVWTASELALGLSIAVGLGGAGGSGTVGASGSGSAVYVGGVSTMIAPGGGGGGLGGASAGLPGAGGAGVPASNGGGASSVSVSGATGKSFDRPDAPGGGGGGGGIDAAGTARNGGGGGDGGALAVRAGGGSGGAGATGLVGAAAPLPNLYWAGGGGGGGAANASGAGYDGAAGGAAGGGGGGGGAGTTAGGSGGAGAAGVVWIIATG